MNLRCGEVVTYCELHKQLYSTTPGTPDELNCCGVMLNPRPFFTQYGTCFVAAKRAHESFPFVWSSVEFWLNFDQSQTPGENNP